MPPPQSTATTGNDRETFRTGPQWLWLIGSLIVFGLLLDHQLKWMNDAEMPAPVLSSIMMPTWGGWSIVAFAGLYVFLFSVMTTVIVDRAARQISTSSWAFGFIPMHAKSRAFDDVRYVRIGLENAGVSSLASSMAAFFVNNLKRLVLFWLFGIWVLMFRAFVEPDSSPTDDGVPVAHICFENRDGWTIGRGSEERVEGVATRAARAIGVRLGG